MEKKRRGGRALRAHGRHHVVEGVPFPRATSRSRVDLHLVLFVLHPVSSYTTGTEDEGGSYFTWRWPLTSRSNTCHFSTLATSAVQAFMSSCGITLRPNAFPVSRPTKLLYLLPPTFIDDNDSTYYWVCARIGRPAKCTLFYSQKPDPDVSAPRQPPRFLPWTPPLFHAHLPTLLHKQAYLRKNTNLGK